MNQDETMSKNCISLVEDMIANNNTVAPMDYLKLGTIYGWRVGRL